LCIEDFLNIFQHDDEEPQNVELEPEVKTAASLSHAMLQQLTVSAEASTLGVFF
jgi:hypothetical protein